MADKDALRLAGRIGWLRLAVGVGLAVAPRMVSRVGSGTAPSGDMVLMTRTVGIRDLVFGAGCLSAARNPDGLRDVRRWLAVWLASDIADVVAGVAARRHVGYSGAAAAAIAPLPFVAAGVWTLRRLPAR